MEQTLSAIHQANRRGLPVVLGLGTIGPTVALLCDVPQPLAPIVLGQLGAHYPHCTLTPFSETVVSSSTWSAELRLHPDLFPIRRYPQFEDALNRNSSDPLTAIFAALAAGKQNPFPSRLEIIAWPAARRRVSRARRAVRLLACSSFRARPRIMRLYARLATAHSPFYRLAAFFLASAICRGEPPLTTPPPTTHTHDREDDLQGASDKVARHLFDVRIRLLVFAPRTAVDSAREQIHRLAGALGQFVVPGRAAFSLSRVRFHSTVPLVRRHHGFLLSCEELATLWHPATSTVRAPTMQVTESRELEPPVNLPFAGTDRDLAILGRTRFRSHHQVFGIRPDDRGRHVAIIGKTGMGKTTLLQQLVASDIAAGRGLASKCPARPLSRSSAF
jgi:hypothetical protein